MPGPPRKPDGPTFSEKQSSFSGLDAFYYGERREITGKWTEEFFGGRVGARGASQRAGKCEIRAQLRSGLPGAHPARFHCSMESPQEFSARAARLLAEAKRLSSQFGDDYAELNRWMAQAKRRRMTWVDGLAFAIERMRADARPCFVKGGFRNSRKHSKDSAHRQA